MSFNRCFSQLDPEEVRQATLKVLEDIISTVEMIECNDKAFEWTLPLQDIRKAIWLNEMLNERKEEQA